MKQHIVRVAVLGCLFALSACGGSIAAKLNDATSGVTGAAPLDPSTDQIAAINAPDAATDATAAAKKKAALLDMAAQSYANCGDYKRLLLLGSRSSNFLFDMAATTFSTLGTVFTHVDVIHGFTAATAIVTGTKTALDADIYQNATAPLMVQAINQTYAKEMTALLAQLETPDNSKPAIEYPNIVQVNGDCSLTEAMDELQTLQQGTTPPATNPRIAFNTHLASLAAAQRTALEQAMTTAGLPPTAAGNLKSDQVQLMAWAAAPSTSDAQVQQMDTAVAAILKP